MFVTIGVFKIKGFKFQPNVCNRCHDLLIIYINLRDIAILNIKSVDYCWIISGISKNKVIDVMQNPDLTEKSGALHKYRNLLSRIKWVKKF